MSALCVGAHNAALCMRVSTVPPSKLRHSESHNKPRIRPPPDSQNTADSPHHIKSPNYTPVHNSGAHICTIYRIETRTFDPGLVRFYLGGTHLPTRSSADISGGGAVVGVGAVHAAQVCVRAGVVGHKHERNGCGRDILVACGRARRTYTGRFLGIVVSASGASRWETEIETRTED